MQTKTTLHGGTLSIKIEGHITGSAEVSEIRNILSSNPTATIVELNILDAFVIPSALIGLLVRRVNVEHSRVIIQASSKELKNLLSDLSLDTIFEVR